MKFVKAISNTETSLEDYLTVYCREVNFGKFSVKTFECLK